MRRLVTRIVAVTAAIVSITATITVIGAAPAQAASYSTSSMCGSSYRFLGTIGLYTNGSTGTRLASMHVAYNSSNGYNCAWMDGFSGTKHTELMMQRSSDGYGYRDSGSFSRYAGPIKFYAANTCIRLHGIRGDYGRLTDWMYCS